MIKAIIFANYTRYAHRWCAIDGGIFFLLFWDYFFLKDNEWDHVELTEIIFWQCAFCEARNNRLGSRSQTSALNGQRPRPLIDVAFITS